MDESTERRLKEEAIVMRGIIKYLLIKEGFSLGKPTEYQELLSKIENDFGLRRDDLERIMRSILEEMLNEMIIPPD